LPVSLRAVSFALSKLTIYINQQKDTKEIEGHVYAFSESDLRLKKYFIEHSLSEAVLRYWKKKFDKKLLSGKFSLVHENADHQYQNSVLMSIQFKSRG